MIEVTFIVRLICDCEECKKPDAAFKLTDRYQGLSQIDCFRHAELNGWEVDQKAGKCIYKKEH